jgi:hypothetical protein
MSGSTRTVQVTLGIRQIGAAIVAVVLATVLAGVVALGQLTAAKPETDAGAALAASAAPATTDAPGVVHHGSGSGGSNGTRFPQ